MCERCGQTFEPDADYCNRCNVSLTEQNSVNVFDVQANDKEKLQVSRTQSHIAHLLIALLILFPFTAVLDSFPLAETLFQKSLMIVLGEIIFAFALWSIKTQSYRAKYASVVSALFLLMFFPFGIVVAGYMLFHILKHDW